MEPLNVPDLPGAAPSLDRKPGDPVEISVIVKWPNGAYREFLAVEPLGYRFLVEAADERMGRTEPKLLITFAGNPLKGGVQVDSRGVAP